MGTWTIKYTIMFFFITYSSIEIFSILDYGFPPSRDADYFFFLGFIILCGIYLFSKKFFIMTFEKLNKIPDNVLLSYKVVQTNDGKYLEKLYVKKQDWFSYIWYEVDYPFVLSKDSSMTKINFFIKKYSSAGALKKWMCKRMEKEQHIEEKKNANIDFWEIFCLQICALVVLALGVSCINILKY